MGDGVGRGVGLGVGRDVGTIVGRGVGLADGATVGGVVGAGGADPVGGSPDGDGLEPRDEFAVSVGVGTKPLGDGPGDWSDGAAVPQLATTKATAKMRPRERSIGECRSITIHQVLATWISIARGLGVAMRPFVTNAPAGRPDLGARQGRLARHG